MTGENRIYLDGMIRAGENLLTGSGSKALMFFYMAKCSKAVDVEVITPIEWEALQKYQKLLPDIFIGSAKQREKINSLIIQGANHEKTKQYHL